MLRIEKTTVEFASQIEWMPVHLYCEHMSRPLAANVHEKWTIACEELIILVINLCEIKCKFTLLDWTQNGKCIHTPF